MNARMLYGKLEDWVYYTFKVENEAVVDLTKELRAYIEKEAKIQREISLNYVDVVISNKVLNFLTPPVMIII